MSFPTASTSSIPPPLRKSTCSSNFCSHTQGRRIFALLAPSLAGGPSSTSLLVPWTAQGKPIPVDDSTAQYRTSALRRINSHFPSRQRYSKSSSSHSKTYSEPILVRSYHPPAASRHVRSSRAGTKFGGGPRPGLISTSEADDTHTGGTRGLLFASQTAATMARGSTKSSTACAEQDAQLPPLEAFSFKSFMNNIDQDKGGVDINADLDRIAEICARSRYSLSNQYEVHSGSQDDLHGCHLAASDADVPASVFQMMSDEETNGNKQKKRRHSTKRKGSRAVSTLETIMSSNRSSDEERPRPKPDSNGIDVMAGEAVEKGRKRRQSTSLALIDSSTQAQTAGCSTSRKSRLKTGLIGEPAVPQTSTKQLQIRTAGQAMSEAQSDAPRRAAPGASNIRIQPAGKGSIATIQDDRAQARLLATLSNWTPWVAAKDQGRAEGSLRHLLKTADVKGKGVFGMA